MFDKRLAAAAAKGAEEKPARDWKPLTSVEGCLVEQREDESSFDNLEIQDLLSELKRKYASAVGDSEEGEEMDAPPAPPSLTSDCSSRQVADFSAEHSSLSQLHDHSNDARYMDLLDSVIAEIEATDLQKRKDSTDNSSRTQQRDLPPRSPARTAPSPKSPRHADMHTQLSAARRSVSTSTSQLVWEQPAALDARRGSDNCCDVTSGPVSEVELEREKRWALLRVMSARQADLERRIAELKRQLAEEAQRAQHHKLMEQELIISHNEREAAWEKEKQASIQEKRKLIHNLKRCYNVLVALQRTVREKDQLIAKLLNKTHHTHTYHVIGDGRDESSAAADISTNHRPPPRWQHSQQHRSLASSGIFPCDDQLDTMTSTVTHHHQQQQQQQQSEDEDSESECRLDLTSARSRDDSDIENQGLCEEECSPPPSVFAHEVSQMRRLVSSCRATAEKQYLTLRTLVPDSGSAAAAGNPRVLARLERRGAAGQAGKPPLIKSATFPRAVMQKLVNDSNLPPHDSVDSDEGEDTTDCGKKQVAALRTTLGQRIHAALSTSAQLLGSPVLDTPLLSDAACNDPFELDLKVKYSSTENLAHMLHSCSLSSPLISPCSSFDGGSHGNSIAGSAFGSSGIIHTAAAANGSSVASPVRHAQLSLTQPPAAAVSANARGGGGTHIRSGSADFNFSSGLHGMSGGGGQLSPPSITAAAGGTPSVSGGGGRMASPAAGVQQSHPPEHEASPGGSHDHSLMQFDAATASSASEHSQQQQQPSLLNEFDPLDC